MVFTQKIFELFGSVPPSSGFKVSLKLNEKNVSYHFTRIFLWKIHISTDVIINCDIFMPLSFSFYLFPFYSRFSNISNACSTLFN